MVSRRDKGLKINHFNKKIPTIIKENFLILIIKILFKKSYFFSIRNSDMVSILNFMYNGEVNVNQEDLQSFLAAAEELRIKGLSQVTTGF